MNGDLRDVLELVFSFGKRYGIDYAEYMMTLDKVAKLEESKESLALENKKLREKIERMKGGN